MLEVTRESLQQRYADLVDAELLRRLRADTLTDLAREVALAELAERGISADAALAAAAAPAERPVDAELDFPADEFERNPYQPPRAAASNAATAVRAQRRDRAWNVLWLGYAGCLGLLNVIDMAGALTGSDAGDIGAEKILPFVATCTGLAGLVGWRLRRAWLHPLFWIACLAVNLAWLSVQGKQIWQELAAAGDLHPAILAGVGIAAALYLPLFWGLSRYALTSTPIWRGSRGRSDATQA